MSIIVRHCDKYAFEARARNHLIRSDHPASAGGSDTAMTPAELFVASLGLSMAVYIQHFCHARNLPDEKFSIHLDWDQEENPVRLSRITACVHLPSEVPERYREALRHAAESCPLENTLRTVPKIDIQIG